jgi:protease-4
LGKIRMNSIYLYRQILKGKWFIHYSYALSLGTLLSNILSGKEMTGTRDWNQLQIIDLEKSEGRSKFPIQAGSSANTVSGLSSFDEAPEGSVAIIPLKSVMIKYGTWCEYGTEEIAAAMLKAGASDKIDAIVLDIDSGGGAVDAIPPMLEAIRKVQTEFNKPVIACGDLCASAAYYVASRCNMIIAGNNLSSEFGSIGVMMSFIDMQPYYEEMGVKFHRIYAPESNYKNLSFENALKGDYKMLQQEDLSPLAVSFQNAIKENRGSKLDLKADGLLNGRMFYATDAKKVGLIDEVGNMDLAISLAQGLSEVKKLTSS